MKKLGFVLLLLAFVQCSSTPPIQSGSDSAGIGITVVINIHTELLSWEDLNPEKIYFVKLNSAADTILKNEICESNYSHESFWGSFKNDSVDNYILNLKPGVYAAVGAYGTSRDTNKPYFILFPQDVIKSSIIEVKANSLRYMGKFEFATGEYFSNIGKSDEAQRHYYDIFFPLNNEIKKQYNVIIGSILDSGKIAASVKKISNSSSDEAGFLNKNKNLFKKTF
jgi:hypothetical protein